MLFLGLSIYAWITIVTIVVMFGIMMFSKLPADIVFMGGVAVLFVTGVLSTKEALSGFSSVSVVTVGVLFVVIAGLVHTGVIHCIVKYVLGTPSSYPKAMVRIMLPVAAMSAFLSNTTVVALFLNVVRVWSKKLKTQPSRLLIPLSYAACMGGACTLIGSPANLVVANFYTETSGKDIHIFTPTIPGLCCLAIGIISLLLLRKLIANRQSPEDEFEKSTDYTVELLVPTLNPHIGETVSEAGLLDVKGGRLIEIIRFDKEIIHPVQPDEYIMGGDRLIYSGQVTEILDLKESHALVNAPHHVFSVNEVEKGRKLRTAQICPGSALLGKTMGDCNLENISNMTLVAVAREGERIDQSPHDIKFKLGDVLLFECPKNGINDNMLKDQIRFFDSEELPEIGPKTIISSLIMLAMILLSTFKVVPLLQSCFLAALAMLLTRCLPIRKVNSCINWEVLMVFAGSVCLGIAIEKTGIATLLAESLLSVCAGNAFLVLLGVCLLGTTLTEFISNTACAAMLAPIALSSATALGANPLTFCVGLMIAVSSSFATPIGSPTHLLIYGPGGYRFSDFMKIGIPIDIILLIANIAFITLIFPL